MKRPSKREREAARKNLVQACAEIKHSIRTITEQWDAQDGIEPKEQLANEDG